MFKKYISLFSLVTLMAFIYFGLASAQTTIEKTISPSKRTAIIVRAKGQADYLKAGEKTWQPATKGMILSKGDTLKTGPDSYIDINFGPLDKKSKRLNVVRVSANTTMTLNIMEPKLTEIGLSKGELSCLVEKLQKGSTFRVRTPTAICGSRGTGWQVSYGTSTLILVYEHAVYAVVLDKNGNPTGREFIINEGSKEEIAFLKAQGLEEITQGEKERWNSWRKDVGKLLVAYILPGGPTAGAYMPPGPSEADTLGNDADSMNNDASGNQNDANNDQQSEQNTEGNQVRLNSNPDTDGDGVPDSSDLYPLDPNRASGNDLDGDGIDDEFDNDIDGDGLTNSDEDNIYGTDKRDDDTDNDNLKDGDEVAGNTPYNYVTDPTLADTDNDGVLDGHTSPADRFPLDTYEQKDTDSDVPTYWQLSGLGDPGTNLFMSDKLYPGDNEDAFPDDPTINGDPGIIHTDEFGNPYYGWHDAGGPIVRGYGSRYEMRKKILEKIEEGDLRNDINQATHDIYLRDMDAKLNRVADYQAHKVMLDRWGNRVRTDSYVLKPTNNTVQFLAVNLRTAGPNKGVSSYDFRVIFDRDISGQNLKSLPWDHYMDNPYLSEYLPGFSGPDDIQIVDYEGDNPIANNYPLPTEFSLEVASPTGNSVKVAEVYDPIVYSTSGNAAFYQIENQTAPDAGTWINGDQKVAIDSLIPDWGNNFNQKNRFTFLDFFNDGSWLMGTFYLIGDNGQPVATADDDKDYLDEVHGIRNCLNPDFNMEMVFYSSEFAGTHDNDILIPVLNGQDVPLSIYQDNPSIDVITIPEITTPYRHD